MNAFGKVHRSINDLLQCPLRSESTSRLRSLVRLKADKKTQSKGPRFLQSEREPPHDEWSVLPQGGLVALPVQSPAVASVKNWRNGRHNERLEGDWFVVEQIDTHFSSVARLRYG